jgi:hypothetical protein
MTAFELGDLFGGVDAGRVLDHREGHRHLALELVGHAHHGHLGDRRVGLHGLLDLAGAQAVAGDVDHVVGAAEDLVVAGVVLDAPVEAGIHQRLLEQREVGGHEALVVAPHGGQAARRQRRHDADDALLVGAALGAVVAEQAHVVAIHREAGEPSCTSCFSTPGISDSMAQPVSVCQ